MPKYVVTSLCDSIAELKSINSKNKLALLVLNAQIVAYPHQQDCDPSAELPTPKRFIPAVEKPLKKPLKQHLDHSTQQ